MNTTRRRLFTVTTQLSLLKWISRRRSSQYQCTAYEPFVGVQHLVRPAKRGVRLAYGGIPTRLRGSGLLRAVAGVTGPGDARSMRRPRPSEWLVTKPIACYMIEEASRLKVTATRCGADDIPVLSEGVLILSLLARPIRSVPIPSF